MRRPSTRFSLSSPFIRSKSRSTSNSKLPIIQITNSTFYRHHPASATGSCHAANPNPPLFPNLNFELPSYSWPRQYWSIIGPSSSGKTTFLEILRGQHLCFPPNGRSFPYLGSEEIDRKCHRLRFPGHAIQYVGFKGETGGLGGQGTRGAYLSARYESRREETDFSLLDYLLGHTELNPVETEDSSSGEGSEDALLKTVVKDLKLENFLTLPVGSLSNGQTRRARIARALLGRPEVLLLDEPFMGLDPSTVTTLSPLLRRLAASHSPRLILSLRSQDLIPEWITHLIYLGPDLTISHQGPKGDVLHELRRRSPTCELSDPAILPGEIGRMLTSRSIFGRVNAKPKPLPAEGDKPDREARGGDREFGEPLVEMDGVRVRYGEKEVVGGSLKTNEGKQKEGLRWTVRRGERWGLFGPNGIIIIFPLVQPEVRLLIQFLGSGKTTVLSLICSDHPQTYSQPIKLFGHSRLPTQGQPGISIFDIQNRIGHSSPEIHAFFPKNLTVRQVLENAWADTFLGKPQLNGSRDRDVDACLRWFQDQLNSDISSSGKPPTSQDKPPDPVDQTTQKIRKRIRKLNERQAMEAEIEDFFSTDLDWADSLRFRDLPFSAQRVALFLRAVIKKPDLVVLDEAFSGMDNFIRDKCMLFLVHGETKAFTGGLRRSRTRREAREVRDSALNMDGRVRFRGLSGEQALICVSHIKDEVPQIVKEWIALPEAGSGLPSPTASTAFDEESSSRASCASDAPLLVQHWAIFGSMASSSSSFSSSVPSPEALSSAAASSLNAAPVSLLSSSLHQLKSSATNGSWRFLPSPNDILMVVPRLVGGIGSFAFVTVPERVDDLIGLGYGGRMREIAQATGEGGIAAAGSIASVADPAQGGGEAAVRAAIAGGGQGSVKSTFQAVRGFGSVFAYMTSHWAVVCFTTAIILNRAQIWASTRRHLVLNLFQRSLLRIIPIAIFVLQTKWFLQAMRCQTSPDFSTLRYGDPEKLRSFDFNLNGGMLYRLSSFMLFWQNDGDSCVAAGMIPPTLEGNEPWELRGSFTLLTPLFYSLCASQLVETISCSVQGRQVQAETGMSIFEHSLAFAEAEAMISNNLDWKSFGILGASEAITASTALKRSVVLARLNTPPEVLLIGLISSLSHLSSHILGVLALQDKLRLLNTGLWGLCFMGAFVWSFLTFSSEVGGDAGILRFPTVCIVGFIPHILILFGISICVGIYLVALLLSALSLPIEAHQQQPRSLRERLWMAQGNLQANVQLSSLKVTMREDFYSALMKIGFSALTAASEAVYLNEGRAVGIRRWTWLEEERIREIERERTAEGQYTPQDWMNVGFDVEGEKDSENAMNGARRWKSGYARERKTQGLINGKKRMRPTVRTNGVGAAERTSRWFTVWKLFKGIFFLLVAWLAAGLLKVLIKVGIQWRPRWLARMVRLRRGEKGISREVKEQPQTLEFWLLSDDGILSLPDDENIDVEMEMRKRLNANGSAWGPEQEKDLDANMYGWWLNGGWFGSKDSSGDYQPQEKDDDVSSVISVSTSTAPGAGSDWESSDGRTTPTQDDFPAAVAPLVDDALNLRQLAQLLNPKSPEEREESTYLAHHLAHPDRILTRSRFRTSVERDKARILTSTHHRPPGFTIERLSADEEAELLEYLLLSRRSETAEKNFNNHHNRTGSDGRDSLQPSSSSWADGGVGLGSAGPQCVICQSAPRTILVWPCRCLALCEECRVSLAMKNFGNCVCCRRDVSGFSRLFVP
ncbi:hypothetical protein FGG08_000171 [Glutinoglossum americanum]|uniref:ABC transporter domain-containing protein n=1 Tax=Glutinoglossum americanum TaxID=1670608 RepID=A0A9P8L1L6_9PEZI|nr:hypothetical protein FGG08_000171 [Glutinoglossum americanum]